MIQCDEVSVLRPRCGGKFKGGQPDTVLRQMQTCYKHSMQARLHDLQTTNHSYCKE